MDRKLGFAIGLALLGFRIAFSEVAPVKYLAGKSETGQPHLYWFGAAAVESSLYYDDGSAELFVNVLDIFADNQLLVRFGVSTQPCLINALSVLVSHSGPFGDSSIFVLSLRRDNGSNVPGEFFWNDTLKAYWNADTTQWVVSNDFAVLIENDTSFWGSLHWLPDSPKNPRLGDDWSGNSGRNFVGFDGSFSPAAHGGNKMIRANILVNDLTSEAADSFWIYRGTDSSSVSYVATINSGQFDFVDAPTTGGDYYYRVTRWQGGVESPPSNAIRLTASPTAVEDRQIEKHAILLSEPFPNPASAGVLFTARTNKQMQLGFSIYNLLGQKVFSKPPAGYPAGEHPFFWNGQDASGKRLPSGMYLLRFRAGEEVLVKKITLLR